MILVLEIRLLRTSALELSAATIGRRNAPIELGHWRFPLFGLEVLKDGFRKNFVMADVDGYALCLVRGMEAPPSGSHRASEHEKN